MQRVAEAIALERVDDVRQLTVGDGVRGFVVTPIPEAVAAALRRLMDDDTLAETLGRNAFELARTITWPDTVAVLLGEKTAVQYPPTS